ncbi:class I SAM-dependent methyltransferase [Odoribacter sp. OttesenSCG-928-L07]|nr:class I SAM-dependent methyltransferase [Odoribacter sp. OttesenSCG-928-L07]MDL2238955.1 class I SAM-dependent methyltransferase [Bacteroidales bacterium OttesenSCG-928-L14]
MATNNPSNPPSRRDETQLSVDFNLQSKSSSKEEEYALREDYATLHSGEESDLLKRLDRETNLKTLYPRMMSGHLQGQFLRMVTRMINPKNILELGTFTGYSTLCFAETLTEEGKIYTIEANPEWQHISEKYFSESGLKHKIEFIIGNAAEIIPQLDVDFELAFIDADKQNNRLYYDMLVKKMKSGSFILIDNVLWSGKVIDLNENKDKDTQIIHAFNEYVNNDKRVENILLPFRDGLTLVRIN